MDISKYGVDRPVHTATWNTALTLAASCQFEPGERIDLKSIGEAVTKATGRRFQYKGKYNRVFAHLAHLAKSAFMWVDEKPQGEAHFTPTTQGYLLGKWLREEGWYTALMDQEKQKYAYPILTLGALLVIAEGKVAEFEPSALADLVGLSEGQVREAVRMLRAGFSTECPKTGRVLTVPKDSVRFYRKRWQVNRQVELDFDSTGIDFPSEVDTPSEDLLLPLPVDLSEVHLPEGEGTTEEVDIEALLEDAQPALPRRPKMALTTAVHMFSTKVDAEEVDLSAVPLGDLPIRLDAQFQSVLEREAAYLGVSSGDEALRYYLQNIWLPDLVAAQRKREAAAKEQLRSLYGADLAELMVSREALSQDSESLLQAEAELEKARQDVQSREQKYRARLTQLLEKVKSDLGEEGAILLSEGLGVI